MWPPTVQKEVDMSTLRHYWSVYVILSRSRDNTLPPPQDSAYPADMTLPVSRMRSSGWQLICSCALNLTESAFMFLSPHYVILTSFHGWPRPLPRQCLMLGQRRSIGSSDLVWCMVNKGDSQIIDLDLRHLIGGRDVHRHQSYAPQVTTYRWLWIGRDGHVDQSEANDML